MLIAYEYMTTSYIQVTAGIPTIRTPPKVVISVEDFIFIIANVIDNLLNGIFFFSHFSLLYDKDISILKCKNIFSTTNFILMYFFITPLVFLPLPPLLFFPLPGKRGFPPAVEGFSAVTLFRGWGLVCLR